MRRSFLAIAAVAASLALAACATQPASAPKTASADPLTQISSFTLTDLQNASADAHAHNDQAAYQCYDYLIAVLPTLQISGQSAPTLGAFVAFQKGRDIANGLGGARGQLKSLNIACAALVIDTQTIINKLALIGVGSAATGNVVGPLLPVVNGAVGAAVGATP